MTHIQMQHYRRSQRNYPQSSQQFTLHKTVVTGKKKYKWDKLIAALAVLVVTLFLLCTTILHSFLPRHRVQLGGVAPQQRLASIRQQLLLGGKHYHHHLDETTHDDRHRHGHVNSLLRNDNGARSGLLQEKERVRQKMEKQRKKSVAYNNDNQGADRPVGDGRPAMLQSGSSSSRSSSYEHIRQLYDRKFPQDTEQDMQRLHDFVDQLRKPKHGLYTVAQRDLPYDVDDCPDHPPAGYPIEWPILDLMDHWNPGNISASFRPDIYQGICRFDFRTELHKALNYRAAELPFILRDDPEVLKVVERWNQPDYLARILGRGFKYRTEYSETNSLMFFREPKEMARPPGWEPPMRDVKMTYEEWAEKASQPEQDMGPDRPHWYFRVNAKGGTDHIMFRELPFFLPRKNLYIVDESDTRGINCRFGMMGNTAAAHFDGSRNFIMLFGGERRYILSHPKNCKSLALYPRSHPSGRHSALDWSQPDLNRYPEFQNALGNEVVLQAGDVLYLPTHWFHFIVSLDLNWQCNARSGITDHYEDHILRCGF